MLKMSAREQGFTLLEVLLSLVLLFIILTSFMGFFTQSARFMNKNEQKLETSQTAQKVINLIDDRVTEQKLLSFEKTKNITSSSISITKSDIEQLIAPKKIESPYSVRAEVLKTPEDLYQFKVIVEDTSDKNDHSETFTYVRR